MIRKAFPAALTAAVILSTFTFPAAGALAESAVPSASPAPDKTMAVYNISIGTAVSTPTPTPEPTPTPTMAVYYININTATPTPEPTPEPTAAPDASDSASAAESEYYSGDDYEVQQEEDVPTVTVDDTSVPVELQKGYRGKAVEKLQNRLIEKGYLSDTADGIYGSNTEDAVLLFQFLNGMSATGIADTDMQALLYSEDCPDGIDYPTLDFETALNDPDSVDGMFVHINGRVLQAIPDTNVILRVASRGAYEDVVYVVCERTDTSVSLEEGDRISIYGTVNGTYTYQTAGGKIVTLPYIQADLVTKR